MSGSAVGQIAAEVGPPGVLVNTIGIFHPGDTLTATPEDLRLMIDDLDAESGRGLEIVAALSARWGAQPQPFGGKIVWAMVRY